MEYLFRLPAPTRQATLNTSSARFGKINAQGEIAAFFFDTSGKMRAAIYRNGQLTNANIPPPTSGNADYGSYPLDLNDHSQMLVAQQGALTRLYLWENGVSRLLEMPYADYEYFFGGAINSAAQVVGQVSTPEFDSRGQFIRVLTKAYLWANGIFTTFGSQGANALAINDTGLIAGTLALNDTYTGSVVLWKDLQNPVEICPQGIPITLAQDGAVLIRQTDTNNAPVGTALWVPTEPNGTSGTLTPLSQLPSGFIATEMNQHRDVVGFRGELQNAGSVYQPYVPYRVLQGASAPEDLNTLIPSDSGWHLEIASGINDAGQITGQGYRTLADGSQEYGAFLLTPNATQ